jgi:hypothetical protein
MKSLTSVDLSWNRITDDGIKTLITLLKPLLLQPEFGTLSIKGNYGANRANIRKIVSSLEYSEQAVINSKIKFE